MFRLKKDPNATRPRLQGEDFDIYPDLGERAAKKPAEEEEPPQEEEAEPEPTNLQKKVAEIPEKRWRLFSMLGGALLGGICGALIAYGQLFLSGGMDIMLAFLIAIFVPSFAERQFARPLSRFRVSMAITLAVFLGVHLLITYVSNPASLVTQ